LVEDCSIHQEYNTDDFDWTRRQIAKKAICTKGRPTPERTALTAQQ
jgi:hypothetical protein